MSGHNNPIKLARSESLRIEPSLSDLDVAVSVGTGSHGQSVSPMTYSYRDVLLDGGIPRVWRGYMANSFDGDKIFWEVVDGVPKDIRDSYIRLNVTLPENDTGLDDTTRLNDFEQCVKSDSLLPEHCEQAVYALFAASFYFELDGIPHKFGSGFRCLGTIRCRLPGPAMVALLHRLNPWRLAFVTNNRLLGDYEGKQDLCPDCHRYYKRIQFHVTDLEQRISIYMASVERPKKRLSAFPQTMKWFIDQQGLNSPFGTAHHRNPLHHSCDACSRQNYHTTLKRNPSRAELMESKKKARLPGDQRIHT